MHMDPSISNPCWVVRHFSICARFAAICVRFAAFCRFPALAQEDFSVQHLEKMLVSFKEKKETKRYGTPKRAHFLGSPEKKCYD